jgi:hypothetical protein
MEDQLHSLIDVGSDGGSLLASVLQSASQVLIKKLSNNDRDWSYRKNKRQDGVYMPFQLATCGFFPALAKQSGREGKSDILECFFDVHWPQLEVYKAAHLVNYTSKGKETHLTGLPRDSFKALSPASYMVISKVRVDGAPCYRAVTIDSSSDDAISLTDTFGLSPDFSFNVFEPEVLLAAERDLILDFVDQLITAWKAGDISSFAAANVPIPKPHILASCARDEFMSSRSLLTLDPFILDRPGDAILEISRKIELELFRSHQRKSIAVRLVRLIMGDAEHNPSASDVIRSLVNNISLVDDLMLSAGQQRKVRAGYSFEFHIEAMLQAAQIPFQKQILLPSNKRPDFLLPSFTQFSSPMPGTEPGIILSAKTTLRERWKQVKMEKGDGDLFLATLDEGIASVAISDMANHGIVLVVPESLQTSKNTEYKSHANVLSFTQFFRDEVRRKRMPDWMVIRA